MNQSHSSSDPDSSSDRTSKPTPASFLVAGIGASAGGIQALRQFFQHVPANSDIAYVVILHLSPEYESHLADILRVVATIPVTQVTEPIRIQPNQIYVIAPNLHLTMQDGTLVVTPNITFEERRAPVDIFLRTLAESHQDQAVGIILSGTGANGSMGLKRVKERGGVIFVQDPNDAEFDEMPQNAIMTNLVDAVLSAAEIPAHLVAYNKNRSSLTPSKAVDVANLETASSQTNYIAESLLAQPLDENQQQALRQVFTLLRTQTGHDFTNYKLPTILRRIDRRLNVHTLHDISEYVAFLYKNPNEVQLLLKDLLISVTNFFRDKEAFEQLEREILPKLFQGKSETDHVRIWVAGCATGEEAYTIAMLCAELALDGVGMPKVQIFATDIDDGALAIARNGFYTLNDVADISPDRLRVFFSKEGEGFRVQREIREMILFVNHNLLKDAPFSHLDLISCRNLLIYLNRTAQERVLETLHFALNPNGYLFLGGSELPDVAGDLYATVSREQHIFQSRPTQGRMYPIPETVSLFRTANPILSDPSEGSTRQNDNPTESIHHAPKISFEEAHRLLLEQYAPPSVVINEAYDIIHMSPRVGRYFQVSGGQPSFNLLTMVRPELRLALRSGIYQATQNQVSIEVPNLPVTVEGQIETIRLHIRPVTESDNPSRGYLLVIFEPVESTVQTQDPNVDAKEQPLVIAESSITRQLEGELSRLKIQLRLTNEQHEVQSEELKASNEELQAVNEELRSAAEELETSKEELQSINEELRTVNQELKVKIDEVTRANNNLQNLTNSVDIGIIFLDRVFRINLFTPAIRSIFNLRPQDLNRPLTDITHQLAYPNLLKDAEHVLETLQPIEREVQTIDGHTYLMRLLPYRTADDRIQGVVITFVNIDQRKQAEEALRASERRQSIILETIAEGVVVLDQNNNFVSLNTAAERILGIPRAELMGQSASHPPFRRLTLEGLPRVDQPSLDEIKAANPDNGDHVFHDDYIIERPNGSRVVISRNITALRNSRGECIGFVSTITDITERKQAEEDLRRSHTELESRVDARTADLNQSQEELRQLSLRTEHILESERTRIAQDLHDELGGALTNIRFGLSQIDLSGTDPQAEATRADLIQQTLETINMVRRIASELRPPILDDFGLIAALEWQAAEWQKHTHIAYTLDVPSSEHALDPAKRTALFRIFQEALTNIVRHAQATAVTIHLLHDGDQVSLSIQDNGRGIPAQKTKTHRSLGLLGMRERMRQVSGTLEIKSESGQGATITARISTTAEPKDTVKEDMT